MELGKTCTQLAVMRPCELVAAPIPLALHLFMVWRPNIEDTESPESAKKHLFPSSKRAYYLVLIVSDKYCSSQSLMSYSEAFLEYYMQFQIGYVLEVSYGKHALYL